MAMGDEYVMRVSAQVSGRVMEKIRPDKEAFIKWAEGIVAHELAKMDAALVREERHIRELMAQAED